MFNKKGEITTQQIVLLIILIVSFIIILLLIVGFDFFAQSDKEICHNSVVMKSTTISEKAIPLDCSRTYICISEDGSCEGMTKPKIVKVETEEDIYSVLAEEMADCWWMFGEGKIDYVGKDFFTKDNYCSICSQVGFDNSVKEIEGVGDELSKDKLHAYLAKTKMPDEEINYAEYFFGTNDVEMLKRVKLKGEDGTEIVAGTFGTIDLDKQHFVMMGITSEVSGLGWKIAAGVGLTVIGWWAPPVWATWAGLISGALVVGAGMVGEGVSPEITAITVEGDGIKNNFMAPTIQEANSNTLKKLDCYDILTSA